LGENPAGERRVNTQRRVKDYQAHHKGRFWGFLGLVAHRVPGGNGRHRLSSGKVGTWEKPVGVESKLGGVAESHIKSDHISGGAGTKQLGYYHENYVNRSVAGEGDRQYMQPTATHPSWNGNRPSEQRTGMGGGRKHVFTKGPAEN